MRHQTLSWFRKRPQRSRTTQRRKIQIEGLESKRLLAGDVSAAVGDADLNGVFDSSDIVRVFQAGKFETGESASFDQGDWNGDGVFDSTDIVVAFQAGRYGLEQPLAAEGEGDDTPIDEDDQAKTKPRRGRHQGRARCDKGADRKDPAAKTIEQLNAGIESGNLPGDLTAEQAQQIVTDLEAAVVAEDRDAIKALLSQVRGEREQDRIQGRIDKLTENIASGELPDGVTPEEAQSLVDGLNQALANDDLDAAKELLKQGRKTPKEGAPGRHAGDKGERAFPAEGVQARIDRLQAAIDAGEFPSDLTPESAAALLAAYTTALETEDLAPVMELKRSMHLEKVISKMQASLEAGKLPGDATAEEVQAVITTAQESLANGDLEGADEALKQLRPERSARPKPKAGGRRGPGGHKRPDADGGAEDGGAEDGGAEDGGAEDGGAEDDGDRPARPKPKAGGRRGPGGHKRPEADGGADDGGADEGGADEGGADEGGAENRKGPGRRAPGRGGPKPARR